MGEICKFCKDDMQKIDGCIKNEMRCNGKSYEPIKVGAVNDLFGEMMEGERCHDCNAKVGEYHHPGCDAEACPVCGEQLISCGCEE